MTLQAELAPALMLPPAFTGVIAADSDDAFTQACAAAGREDAGTLVLVERDDVIDLALVLAPDEPLVTARRALLAGMTALADAVGTHAPPEMPIAFGWPDTLLFDGARIGGGRLGWPEACAEEAVPDWLVFSAMVIRSKAGAGDPGLTPGSTSLEEQGVAPEEGRRIVESFARHLMKSFEVWREDGFAPVAARYLARLEGSGADAWIEGGGDAVTGSGRLALRPALDEPAWRDPATGRVRL